MIKWLKKGFVSVELVIMAAIILATGVAGIVVMGDKGAQAMRDGMDKLTSLGIFGGETSTPSFNSSWYHPSMNVNAEDVNSPSDFVFVLNPDGITYTITEYKNNADKAVVIPKFHTDGKTITGIGESSFRAMGLTSVAFHDSINFIGDYAFEGNELDALYFSNYAVAKMPKTGIIYTGSVKASLGTDLYIGQYAFANNKLTKVELSNGVTSIGAAVFKNNNLTTITLPMGITAIPIEAFANNQLVSVSLPGALTSIGASAFKDNKLVSIDFPESISSLGSYAFQNNKLESLIIPTAVTDLGTSVFRGNNLVSVIFEGAKPLTLGQDIFAENITLPDASIVVSAYQFNSFRSSAQKMGITEVKFVIDPNDANHEGDFVFAWNSTLNGWSITSYVNSTDKDVVIPNTRSDGLPIVQIGQSAFYNMALTSVVLPNSLKSVSLDAFYSNQLSSLTIPSSVTNLYAGSFGNNKLTSVTFLGIRPVVSNSYINNSSRSVFANNSLLGVNSIKVPSAYLASYRHTDFIYPAGLIDTYVTINPDDANLEDGFGYRWDSVNNGWEIFENVNKANKDIVIPQSRLDGKPVVSIGGNTFQRGGLTSLILPEGLKEIKMCAFCINSITDLKLPSTLVKIGKSAFSSNKITNLGVPGGLAIIEESAFAANMITDLILPEGVVTIKQKAFNGNQMKKLVVPSTVTLIEAYSFSDNQLESIVFAGARPTGTAVTTTGTTYAFTNNPTLLDGSVKVKSQYLLDYRSNNLGIPASKFSIMSNDENIEGGLGYFWNTTLNGWEVAEYVDKTVKDIVIPTTRLDGKPIVAISAETFKSSGITSLTLSPGLKEIKASAFKGNMLTTVSIPNGVTHIYLSAFADNMLTSISLPNSLTSIGQDAFRNNKLTSVTIPSSVITLAGGSFRANLLNKVVFVGAKPTTSYYTEYSPFLQVYPFAQNPLLTDNTILVSSNHYKAYSGNYSSFGVTPSSFGLNPNDPNVEGGLGYIWRSEYNGWGVLRAVDTNNKNIVIPSARADGKPVVAIEDFAFQNKGITSLTMNEGLKVIGTSAFANNSIVSVSFPNSLLTIGYNSFNTNNITNLVVPSGITTLGSSSFENNKLTSVTFLGPKPSSSMGTYVFKTNPTLLAGSVKVPPSHLSSYQNNSDYYFGLTTDKFSMNPDDVNVEGGVGYQWTTSYGGGWEVIGSADKTNKNIIIPSVRADGKPVVSIANFAFQNNALTSLTLNEGLKRIGQQSFENNLISNLTLPSSLVELGYGAFTTNKITSLTIPSGVTTLSTSAFESNLLSQVTFSGSKPTTIGNYVFRYNSALTTGAVLVPSTYLSSYQSSFSSLGLSASNVIVGY